MEYKITELSLKGLKLIESDSFGDERGFFTKIFSKEKLNNSKISFSIKQVNLSENPKSGTLRGLHFQEKNTDGKIICCLSGSIFDVAVDIRENSKTFLQYFSIVLDSRKKKFFFIPPGFAHGFQSLENNTNILYLHDQEYFSLDNTCLNPFDPMINIKWPLEDYLSNERDLNQPFIKKSFKGLKIKV
tara:strand:+ start:1881 stop:2441 length:561 start_codon:yes stop_codon:yes gene_type:complete